MIIVYFKITYDKTLEVVGVMRYLSRYTEGMVGEPSFQQLDANSRMNTFYYTAILFMVGLMVFNLLFKRIETIHHRLRKHLKTLEWISVLGCLNVLFYAMRNPIQNGFRMVLVVFLCFLLVILMEYFNVFRFRLKLNKKNIVQVGLISFCFSFLIVEVLQLFLNSLPFVTWYASFGVLFLSGIFFLNDNTGIEKIGRFLIPFSTLPLMSFLSDEIYLILKMRGYELASSGEIYLLLLFLLIVIAIAREIYFFIRKKRGSSREESIYYVVILIGSICLGNMSWSLEKVGWITEFFEGANPILGVYKSFEFGQIPILEYYNSHVLSELIDPFVYTFLNGYDGGISMYNYTFITQLLIGLSAYFFLVRIFKNKFLAFITIMFVPVIQMVVHWTYPTIWIGILILYTAMQKGSLKLWVFFWIIFFGSALWAIDHGLIFMVASFFTVLYFGLIGTVGKKDLLTALKALMITIAVALIPVVAIVVYKEVDLWQNIAMILSYNNSFQSWAYLGLGLIDENFILHYVLFPIFAIMIFAFGVVKRKDLLSDKSTNGFRYFTFIFLTFVYFANAQRGLDRHGLIENCDHISRFFFVVFAFLIWYLIRKMKFPVRSFLLVFVMSLTLLAFKWPEYEKDASVFEQVEQKREIYWNRDVEVIQDRGSDILENMIAEKYPVIRNFDRQNFTGESSFIDMANIPMMYYYLKKPVPFYFNQTLASAHNFELQYDFVSRCKNTDMPYAILTNEHYGHEIDFPNEIRHPVIAEYVFRNYKPLGIMDSVSVWLKNDLFDGVKFSKPTCMMSGDSLRYPIVMSKNKRSVLEVRIEGDVMQKEEFVLIVNDSVYQKPDYFNDWYNIMYFKLEADTIHHIQLISKSNKPYSKHYSLHETENYFMDYYHECPKQYFLGKLPHHYANFEYDTDSEFEVLTPAISPEKTDKNIYQINIPDNVTSEKEGLFLYFEMEGGSPKRSLDMEQIFIEYGDSIESNGKFRVWLSDRNESKYLIRLSSYYNWHLKRNTRVDFKDIPDFARVANVKFVKLKNTVQK